MNDDELAQPKRNRQSGVDTVAPPYPQVLLPHPSRKSQIFHFQ